MALEWPSKGIVFRGEGWAWGKSFNCSFIATIGLKRLKRGLQDGFRGVNLRG